MTPRSAWKLIELDMRGFETELTDQFMTLRHPNATNCSFFQAGNDEDELVDAAWVFAEKLEAYVLNAPGCHHKIKGEGSWVSRTFLGKLIHSFLQRRA